MPARLLSAVVDACCRHAWRTLGLALLLALGAGWYAATHMQMSSDASALISPDVPWRQAERRMSRAFPAGDDVDLIVVDAATPELAERAAAGLAARLAADRAHILSVARPDGGPFFAQAGLLFRSTAEVRDTVAHLIDAQPFLGPLAQDPSLHGIAATLGTMLTGVARGDAALDRVRAPMARLADALARQAAGRPAFFSWQALVTGDAAGRRRLVLVHPRLDYASLMPGAAAADAIRGHAAALGLDAAHGVRVRLTGSVALSDAEFASLADHWWLVAGAMALAMLATLRLATGSWRITAAILGTTIAGLVVTTAAGLAMVGMLNLISVAFIPLFVGLGVDFGIQVAVRFQAERHGGAGVRPALAAAVAAIGPSLLLAAGAVCLGFLAFLPTAYLGVSELGLIASVGMVVALVASVTVLPALLALLDPPHPRGEVGDARMAPLDRLLAVRRRAVLRLFGVALVASVAALPFVRFDFNPLHLRDPQGEAMATLADLMRDPDRNPNTIEALAPDLPAARRLAARLAALPEVDRAVTLASYVPDDQAPKLAAIGDAAALLGFTLDPIAPLPPPGDADTVGALRATATALRAAAAGGGDAAAQAARRLAAQFDRLAAGSPRVRAQAAAMLVPPLVTMLAQARDALAAQPVTVDTLPPDVRADWIGTGGQARVHVVPRPAFADDAGLARFTRAVLAVAPQASGTAVSIQGASRTIAGAFVEAGVLAFAVVSLLLFAALRDMREVLFTLAPVVLSIFLTLGTCVLIGQPVNFANIIAFPLLFGVGVAFHIYFVMAWRGGATDLLQSPLARAILFSALATGTAFGSLWLSRHPGTASMGKVLMLSLVWTLVCALVFEPALLGPPRRRAVS